MEKGDDADGGQHADPEIQKDEVYLAQGPRFEVIIGDPEAMV